MIAININTGKSYESKYAIRIAKATGISEDSIYRWMKKGLVRKLYKDYIYILDSETL
jgi:hypothetical protein